jgi:hypothetical protein
LHFVLDVLFLAIDLNAELLSLVQLLVNDEVAENRGRAEQIVIRFR